MNPLTRRQKNLSLWNVCGQLFGQRSIIGYVYDREETQTTLATELQNLSFQGLVIYTDFTSLPHRFSLTPLLVVLSDVDSI